MKWSFEFMHIHLENDVLVRIGICDDNPEDIRDLSKALYAYEPSFHITSYSDGESLLDDCKDPDVIFDLLFMDINMPGMNGITTAGKIRSHLLDVKIIFISSSNEHYPEAYDVFAFNYIIKPVIPEKLHLILDKALAGMILERRQKFFFSYKNVNYQIFVRDILYMESSEKLICFHMSNVRCKLIDLLHNVLIIISKEAKLWALEKI